MRTTAMVSLGVMALGTVVLLIASPVRLSAQQDAGQAVRIGGDDLGGVVTSANGPEAGVWVIAETTDLPTKFAKIVVTDDQGRYVVPGLPKANYSLWVRGYGLIDSPKIQTAPGKIVNLRAVLAPTAAAAAEYYPAIYWYALLKVPASSEFPGTGPEGNGLPKDLKTQGQWLDVIKTDGCFTCHQLGNKATRTIPKQLGEFPSSAQAWARRIQSGQAMTQMAAAIARIDSQRAFELFGDWTDRIAAGELPASQPSTAAGRGAQCRHYPVGLGGAEELPPRRNRHRQTQSHGQCERPALWLPRGELEFRADSGPGAQHEERSESAGPRSDYPILEEQPHAHRRRTGERRRFGTVSPACTTRCWMKRAGFGLPPESARPQTRSFARAALTIRRLSCSRSNSPTAISPCTIRRPASSR